MKNIYNSISEYRTNRQKGFSDYCEEATSSFDGEFDDTVISDAGNTFLNEVEELD